ncbi:MAG: oxygen-independent coproporphyrinogen III oxidase [Formivibrio sp.]|nr:oxygen-independent coproporphyrinogen III oxidase [Formivibrio sp.]
MSHHGFILRACYQLDAGQRERYVFAAKVRRVLVTTNQETTFVPHYSSLVSELQKIVFDHDLIERYDEKGPRYTTYPSTDCFKEQFTALDYEHILCQQAPGTLIKPLSLYFHLPFCNSICYYCACNKVITKDHKQADVYLDYLIREINLQANQLPHRAKVSQLHLGGGTPTFFSDIQLKQLMEAIRTRFDLLPGGDFSIEIDPRSASTATISLLRELGFKHMSVSILDLDPAVQLAVNRIQSAEETCRVIECARVCGFDSINIDLIYGLPKQTTTSLQATIDLVLQLRPDRLALYDYDHQPERFMPQRQIHQDDLPTTSVKLELLGNSIKQLTDAGYVFIGMSHFALPDDELTIAQRRGRLHQDVQGYSTHSDCDLMAFGVSAISRVGPTYCQNTKLLDDYYAIVDSGQLPVDCGIRLNRDDLLRRSIIQSLLCQFELSFQPLEIGYFIDFKSYFSDELVALAKMAADGLLLIEDDRIFVLPPGRLLVRTIAMTFDRYWRTQNSTDTNYARLT